MAKVVETCNDVYMLSEKNLLQHQALACMDTRRVVPKATANGGNL